MDLQQKALYHQIHPLKLLTDWSSAFLAAYVFWRHRLVLGLAVGLLPPALISAALIAWANLEPHAESRFGRYVRRNMTRAMVVLRLAGVLALWSSAWFHYGLGMCAGLLVVLAAWARGKLWPARPSDAEG